MHEIRNLLRRQHHTSRHYALLSLRQFISTYIRTMFIGKLTNLFSVSSLVSFRKSTLACVPSGKANNRTKLIRLLLCMFGQYTVAIQRETLANPHFNNFDEINFDELLDITSLLDIINVLIIYYICRGILIR